MKDKLIVHDIIISFIILLLVLTTKNILNIYDLIESLDAQPVSNYISYDTTLEVKKENVEDVEKEKYPITESERELITRIVIAESKSEPLEGKIAVAQVILDRWIKQGGSLNEVILAPKQFATPYPFSIEEFPDCRLATHLVFDLGYRVFKEPTLFFFNPTTSEPEQVKLLRTFSYIGTIGEHEFRGD